MTVRASWKRAAVVAMAMLALDCAPTGIVADEMTAAIPRMTAPPGARPADRTHDDSTLWSTQVVVTRPMGAAWLVAYYAQQLERRGWSPGIVLMHDELTSQRFRRQQPGGQPWVGVLTVAALERGSVYDVAFRIVRSE